MLVTGRLASQQIQPSQCCQQLLLASSVQIVVLPISLSSLLIFHWPINLLASLTHPICARDCPPPASVSARI